MNTREKINMTLGLSLIVIIVIIILSYNKDNLKLLNYRGLKLTKITTPIILLPMILLCVVGILIVVHANDEKKLNKLNY